MKNLVLKVRPTLEKEHYIRKADPNSNYWFDFSCPKLRKYQEKFEDKFCLILAGDQNLEGDFYSIPFSVVDTLFIEEYLSNDKNGKTRWVGSVKGHELKVNNCMHTKDISLFYGNPLFIDNNYNLLTPNTHIEDPNEYAIQNRKIEINARQKQSLFRKKVLDNFQEKCCLTGIRESGFLRASHIIPWSHSISSRLDHSNGLSLSVTYNHLFDQGYIRFDNSLKVIVTLELREFSIPFQEILSQINQAQANLPVLHSISEDYLDYHRKNILIK